MITAHDFIRSVISLAPGCDLPKVRETADSLIHRWSEPHRRYHNLTHLAEVIAAADELRHAWQIGLPDMPPVHLAAWFHDSVYDVRMPGNEAYSAAFAESCLTDLGLGSRHIADIVAMITESTMHLVDSFAPASHRVFHDADLWILSAPEKRYRRYQKQVRKEFAHVEDEHFRLGRLAVIRPFAERERLYLTDHAHRVWGPRATRNLTRELAELSH